MIAPREVHLALVQHSYGDGVQKLLVVPPPVVQPAIVVGEGGQLLGRKVVELLKSSLGESIQEDVCNGIPAHKTNSLENCVPMLGTPDRQACGKAVM